MSRRLEKKAGSASRFDARPFFALFALTARTGLRDGATVAFTLLGAAVVLAAPVFDLDIFGTGRRLGAEAAPATIIVVGLMVAAALAYSLVASERSTGTAAFVLSRPISRTAYAAAKLLGVETVLLVSALFVALSGVVAALAWGFALDAGFAFAFFLACLEILVLGAAAVFLASLGRLPLIAAGLGGYFAAGHLAGGLRAPLGVLAPVFSALVPRLDTFVTAGGGLRPDAGAVAVTLAAFSAATAVVMFFAATAIVCRARQFA